MPFCCVHSCLSPGKRFVRFPRKDATLFQQWLERINNPQLFQIAPETVYQCHKVCDRHFAETQLREAFPGSNQRLVVPGACPTLFLDEVIECRRKDLPNIRWDHTYSRIEDNAQNDPTTVAEICVPAERDNDPGATTSSESGTCQTPMVLPDVT